MHPGAERRVRAVEDVPAGVELVLGGVVVVGGPDRAHHGDVVDAGADVRPPVADLDAAAAALAIADLEREDRGHQLAVGEKFAHILVARTGQHVLVRCAADGLAAIFVQSRLGIEALDVAGAAKHKQPDHALGPGREMRRAHRRRCSRHAVAKEHRAERQPGEAHAAIGQERAAGDTAAATEGRSHLGDSFE